MLLIIGPIFFSNANRPKSQFLFHKNLPPRDFSIMTLTAGFDSVNGFDPNNEVIPSCAPEELSNKRFYDALNGEVWMNNATLFGHADFMDPAWVPTILEVFT